MQENPGFRVSDRVQNKLACTVKEEGLKLWIQEEGVLYSSCSENKGSDQLCNFCTADLRLCFHIGKYMYPVFS